MLTPVVYVRATSLICPSSLPGNLVYVLGGKDSFKLIGEPTLKLPMQAAAKTSDCSARLSLWTSHARSRHMMRKSL